MGDERVLVLMPTGRDGERTRAALEGGGLTAVVCADTGSLCREIAAGAGTALLTEEALVGSGNTLQEALRSQPPWSDFPLVVLAREGAADRGLEIREAMNATLVERPVKIRSLLSVVRAALRDRRHQYAVRDHLAERERQAEALRESEDRLHVALRAGRMGTWDIDLATMRMTCSDSCKANYGRGPGEPFTYEELTAGVHEDDQELWRGVVEDAVARSGEFEIEYRTLWPDSTMHWVHVRGNCTTVAGRRLLSGVSLDITGRVLAERTARSGQERLRAALVAARMVAWEWTPADRKLHVSETAADVFGLPAGVGLTGIDQGLALVHPEDVAAYEATYRDAIERRGSYHIHYRLVRPSDGRVIWIEERGTAVFDQPDGGVRLFGVAADVTERKRSEAEAIQLGERLRMALDAGGLGTWEWNPATDEMTVSARASEMCGTPVGGPHGREQGRRMIHPDDRERARRAAEQAVAEKADYDIEYRLADRPVWVAAHGRGLYDATGNLVRVHGVVQDITERKRAEEEAVRMAERLRLALEAGGTGVWEWDIVTGRIIWSDQVHAFYGMAPGEFDGTLETFTRHLHPDDADRAREAIRASVEDDIPYRIEYRIVPKGGGLRWISTAGRVIRDAGGRPLRMIGATSDVTDRRLTEDAIRVSERRFRTLFDSMDQGFCVIEVTFEDGRAADYRFVELNPAFERHSGLSPDLLGKSIREAVPGLEEFWFDTYGRVAATGEPTRFVHHAAPLARWFEVYAFRLENPDRHRVAILFADVTDRMRAEQELRDQDRKKDDFIALLAHELRNPLAPIRNGLQVIRRSDERAARERSQEMMDRQLTHMVRLIDDLLDVSRIGRNKMELRRERVALTDVIASAVETAQPAIEAAGHELSVTLPGRPVDLDADLTRLAQVFSNLLTNSAKYTHRGGKVWITAELHGSVVSVSVRDNGIGIPAAALPTIFDMFSQVDRSIERSTGGLGIGLALVKGLTEMHGGTVTAASEGAGSTFTVTLPVLASKPDARTEAPPAIMNGESHKILVVDDNRDGAESLSQLLEVLGHEVRTAYDGIEAVTAAQEYRPDVILMDVGMPRLNGYDATRQIRAQDWSAGVTIIALTGWGQEGDRKLSKEAGCDGHLVKPVSLPDLERMLGELHRAAD
ncbi:diguanylate cyclase : Sensory box protein OS=Janthinobacterium agaricidamnosum NBRC 102515 = DSM 9628 GN=GJA_4246 PE=4 SV=1: PAS_3: PAS_3: PAS_3: PAS_3: PAS_8: HisKA: HATPase_c: Response_reg [Gemmata massiliana]|uniref:histidine kinase n=1 Tax=Gemmata massiliana TaxID=1210884 RepID=A0A6P2DC39_9BACT|nr:PAS domain-containing protein [Gemmata massiliana]VTR97915.1 diguanylate cyclase : Sensory box protein OS=Janthinobacterium agaricidamnosum NBRC 102515 = DSM 9628 GN=GJA_4246 PE=4 SV=1: PAS_3: PAS_3: PAS_3: PAS_3: PAS_8: HisKA: HATPase_c: Response_reg [Gemmata massiliana]